MSFADPANSFHEKAALCRAAENTCYFATVNCASTGSPTTSAVVRPDGTLLSYQPYGKQGTAYRRDRHHNGHRPAGGALQIYLEVQEVVSTGHSQEVPRLLLQEYVHRVKTRPRAVRTSRTLPSGPSRTREELVHVQGGLPVSAMSVLTGRSASRTELGTRLRRSAYRPGSWRAHRRRRPLIR